MDKKKEDRTFNVSVIGLSGTEKYKGPIGVGKSCFCNRFICQDADKYSHDHISVLSQSDFAGRVINNDHFLYWGEVTKTDDDSNFTFHVIEQTEFIDDVSFKPFKIGQTDPYHKRCIMTKVRSAEKLMYICKNQLGMESDSSYDQHIMPDGKLHIDGFICCFDVSQSQQRTLEQVDFVIHLLNCALKKNKPVVLVTTKTDEANTRYLKEAEKIVARKEYQNNIPLINTSAHENVNIELAFITLAYLIDKTKTRPNIIPFSEAVKQRKHILDVTMEAYKSLFKLKVIDSKAVWSTTKRKLEKDVTFGQYVNLFGTDSAKRLFRKHIAYLRDEQIKKREQFFLQKLPETINHFLPDLISINDKPWSGCQRYIADHPDYDTYFVELAPGDESWKSKQDFVENYSEIRIPFDLLNSSDAEKCFRNHLENLQAEYKKSHTNDVDVVPERHFPTSRSPFRTDESINPDLLPFAGTSEDFHKLLATGTYESFENRVFLCGSCACGKSTLASILIGSPIPLTWKSTDGLVIHFGRNGINLGTYEMVPLKEGGRGHNVLTKVVIGKPHREQTSLCQSVDTDQVQPIEPPSTGTNKLELNLQAIETDIDDVFEVNETTEACLMSLTVPLVSFVPLLGNSQEIPDSKTTKSEMKKVASISLPKTNKIEAYAVHDDILREVKSGQYKIKIAPSDLVDFGGQRSYDMTHQLFVQHGGTFVVMFDGSKDFREPLAEYPTGDISNESIVKHWVNSILTYCVDDGDVMPMILFAATHSDLLTEDMQKNRKTEFVKKVTELFGTHEMKKHFVFDPVFFINGTDKEDEDIQNLKAQLVSIARNQPSWGQRRPLIWVPLELLINNMKKDNINIIPKSYLAEANTMNGDLALSDKQMDDFLLTQHALGKIMYFNLPELNNFIILYPPALVNILRSFVTDEIFWPNDKILIGILRNMTDTGKIYKIDLLKLWQQKQFCNHMPDNDTKDFIIQVLIHLDVLVVPKRYSDRSDAHTDYYLVPCTVKTKMPKLFLDEQSFANRTISLVYKLQKSSIPSALSFKLIGAVSSIWPIKELNGYPLLYQSSAVLCVDGNNEFRIIVEETKVIVYLTHVSSKSLISPDIAASIQECLTSTLEVVLKFYLTSIGKSHQNANVSNLFHIEIGEVCDRSPCLVSISKANTNSDWMCDSGNEHSSRYPLLWFFNKTQNECPSHCPGLAKTILTKSPSEQELARFAVQLTNSTCRDLVLHLGLELLDWQDIEDCYTGMSLIVRIMALHCWKTKRIKGKPTKSFTNLLDAMKAVDETRHLLCKVFREDTDLLDIADVRLQEIPHDDVLEGLPENLGNCAVQLGIELGITVSSIKETMVRYHKDMYKQISDILRKWKSSIQVKPTIYRLMLALERIDTGGLDYLKEIYLG